MDDLIKRVKWVTRVGHELTFMSGMPVSTLWADKVREGNVYSYSGDGPDYMRKVEGLSRLIKLDLKTSNVKFHAVDTDSLAIEISSKPIGSWSAFVRWQDAVRQRAYVRGLVHSTDYCAGGMGHMHVDLPDLHTMNRLYQWAFENPWVFWAFVNPWDKINARSVAQFVIDYERRTSPRFDVCTAERFRCRVHHFGGEWHDSKWPVLWYDLQELQPEPDNRIPRV